MNIYKQHFASIKEDALKVEFSLRGRWLGREIEYRDSLPLSKSTKCFRGRIIRLIPYALALVETTYATSFPVKRYTNTCLCKKHHKNVYRRNGLKFTWHPTENVIHVVRFTGKRWKKIDVSVEYVNHLLKYRNVNECI